MVGDIQASMTKFVKHKVGRGGWTKWIMPIPKGYLMKCCDCGLVHEIEFRIVGVRKQKVQFRARRKKA